MYRRTRSLPVPGADDYRVGIGSRQEGREERGSSSFAVNLKKTYDRNRNDEVTHFLRGAANLALSGLSNEIRPDKRSRWAGEWGDWRYYRVWYSRPPWGNWKLTYNFYLYSENGSVPWKVRVEFGSFKAGLKRRIEELDVLGELKSQVEQLGASGEWLMNKDSVSGDTWFRVPRRYLCQNPCRYLKGIHHGDHACCGPLRGRTK